MNNALVDNASNLDVVMPMYNLIEYSDKYAKASVYGNINQMMMI